MGQIIEAIAVFFGQVLAYIYGLIPNFGIAIILLTLMVKLVTFPLNNKQIQSARRMQELQPELKKIQAKYKNDKEKQNKAVMEFMQQNKMNPMAGCLPLLVQLPILIGIFRLLSDADRFILPIFDTAGLVFNPYLINIGNIQFINLLLQPTDEAAGVVYWAFPIIAGATTYVYQKLTMADTSQKMMMYMMPAMITFFSFSFPAGLVIYWILNNLFSMGQHYLVVAMGKGKEEQAPVKDPGKKREKGDRGDQ
jgi:YidC/Oxa1 family membrane protein insertase